MERIILLCFIIGFEIRKRRVPRTDKMETQRAKGDEGLLERKRERGLKRRNENYQRNLKRRRCLNRLERVGHRQVDVDRLDVGVVLESVFSQLSSNTRLLESSERCLRVKHVVVVDPDGTCGRAIGEQESEGGMR